MLGSFAKGGATGAAAGSSGGNDFDDASSVGGPGGGGTSFGHFVAGGRKMYGLNIRGGATAAGVGRSVRLSPHHMAPNSLIIYLLVVVALAVAAALHATGASASALWAVLTDRASVL